MSIPIESYQRFLPSPIGGALLRELWAKHWDTGNHQHVEALNAALGSTTGRRARNEDRVAFAQIFSRNSPAFCIGIVCDGVGGSEMGDAAATIAVACVIDTLAAARKRVPLALLLTEAVCNADATVRKALDGRGSTTLSMFALSSHGEFAATNIGDSRLYSWAPGAPAMFKQVSTDDTLENELRILAVRDPTALAAHGLRGRLSQALGEPGREVQDLRVRVFGREQFPAGVILGSDGAWKADPLGFELIAKEAKGASDAVRRLLAFASWTGGHDNTSVLAIDDLARLFAELSQTSSSAQVTLWLADQKFVVKDATELRTLPPDDQRTLLYERDRQEQRVKRRPAIKRKPSSKPRPDEPELELDLRAETREPEKPVSRPKLEITFDDEPQKKAS